MYLMSRGQIRMEMTSAEALTRLDEIEEAYLAGTSETEEDHIERKRRKDMRKAWGRQRVRERELAGSPGTGLGARPRTTEDDDHYSRRRTQRRRRRHAPCARKRTEGGTDHGLPHRRATARRHRRVRQDPVPAADEAAPAALGGAGFGTPRQTAMFYVWKIFFYGLFGLIVCGAFTRGLEFNDIGGWWNEPILYQKLMIWTILLEILGMAATCGPMAFHFDPLIGGSCTGGRTTRSASRRTPTTCRSPRATGARRGTPACTS